LKDGEYKHISFSSWRMHNNSQDSKGIHVELGTWRLKDAMGEIGDYL